MKLDTQSLNAGLSLVLMLLLTHYFSGKGIFATTALLLLLLCMIVPGIFKVYGRIWFSLSECMAGITSRLLLTLVFTLLVIPVGCTRRLMGKDALKLSSRHSGSRTLLSERNHRYLPTDLERPY